jgi:hypothetical protein
MTTARFIRVCASLGAAAAVLTFCRPTRSDAAPAGSRQLVFENASGILRTISSSGTIDLSNPFFKSLGINGRSCSTCHTPNEGWTITPEGVQARFLASGGADAVFRSNDGSNCEAVAPGSLQEQWDAYSLLLTRGLIRVGFDLPDNAEFLIDSVVDPYQCTWSSNQVSVYRRPLPSTNVKFLSAIMWDGRESSVESLIEDDLRHQANSATRGHAQAVGDISDEDARKIVAFQHALVTAQAYDNQAGMLNADGAQGGPAALSEQPFFIGINDPIGFNPTNEPFTPVVFRVFDAWHSMPAAQRGPIAEGRQAIARGQNIFNTREITLSGVGGLNGETFPNGVSLPGSFTGTCTVCHDSPNIGNHSVKAPLDIGLTSPSVAPYLPVYTLRNPITGDTVQTTDPGRALITGKWRDINRFKGPILRGLAARAPYFHNGSAATLADVVDFYDTRFAMHLTAQEKADLIAFLRSL